MLPSHPPPNFSLFNVQWSHFPRVQNIFNISLFYCLSYIFLGVLNVNSFKTSWNQQLEVQTQTGNKEIKSWQNGLNKEIKSRQNGLNKEIKSWQNGLDKEIKSWQNRLNKEIKSWQNGLNKSFKIPTNTYILSTVYCKYLNTISYLDSP